MTEHIREEYALPPGVRPGDSLAHRLVMAAQSASQDCGCGPNESAIVAAVLRGVVDYLHSETSEEPVPVDPYDAGWEEAYGQVAHDLEAVLYEIEKCDCGTSLGDNWFDREVCPEPCASMHTRCNGCGKPQEGCPVAISKALEGP